MSTKDIEVGVPLTLSPMNTMVALANLAATNRRLPLFVWGQPGVGKSAISHGVAKHRNVAFVDIRLSQMEPIDLRGIPFPVQQGGVLGAQWTAPLVLPRDLDQEHVIEVEAIETTVHFYNPTGSNNIHYCTDPQIEVRALNPDHTAEVVQTVAFPRDHSEFMALTAREINILHKAIYSPIPGFEKLSIDEKREHIGPHLMTELGTSAHDRPVYLDRFTVIIRDKDGTPVAGKVKYVVTGEAKAIIALEEFNSAPPSVQAAAYQLVLDKRLGEYVVPNGCYIVAMGNREGDRGIVYKMPTPILNRFIHVEMEVNAKDWLEWAISANIHEHVVGYIARFQEKLNEFDPAKVTRGFATPRSWEYVSHLLHEMADTLDEEIMTTLISGSVGQSIGLDFSINRETFLKLPDVADILSGKIKADPSLRENVGGSYMLITSMCYRLSAEVEKMQRQVIMNGKSRIREHPQFKEWNKACDRMLGFAIRNFVPDIAIAGARYAMGQHKLPMDTQNMENFDWFTDKFRYIILPK